LDGWDGRTKEKKTMTKPMGILTPYLVIPSYLHVCQPPNLNKARLSREFILWGVEDKGGAKEQEGAENGNWKCMA
jgi:hypothetical protein